MSHVSTSCVAEDGKSGLEIIADGAALQVTQDSLVGTVDGVEIDEDFDRNPYVTEVEAFLDAVRTGDAAGIRTPYGDAINSLAVTLAVNESIERGEPIDLA